MSSRLYEIIENHKNLDDLLSILKHYSVNAQFVATSIIEQFKKTSEETDSNNETDNDQGNNDNTELLEDLKQYYARLWT